MSASQQSCRDLYQCSSPAIDKLVDICMKHGAFGSRLTGAGWGGCVVSLVSEKNVETFIARVKNEYYGSNDGGKVFWGKAGSGSCVYLL